MKLPLYFAAAAAALICATAVQAKSDSMSASAPPVVHVNIDNYAFKAPSVTIVPGTTVVFKNLDDDPHTVTSPDGLFDSKGLAQGDTWSFRFTKPGTYTYFCKVHPMMRGTVIVKESAT